jgi:hypothetical protein
MLYNKLRQWWRRVTSKGKGYSLKVIDEVPNLPNRNIIYLVTHLDHCWQIVMVCPCGCGQLLYMNAMPEYRPCWKYNIDKKGRISLSPSIHRIVGCKSHFFIKSSRIDWCVPPKVEHPALKA